MPLLFSIPAEARIAEESIDGVYFNCNGTTVCADNIACAGFIFVNYMMAAPYRIKWAWDHYVGALHLGGVEAGADPHGSVFASLKLEPAAC